MTYNDLRHFADSWGLVFMGLTFLGLIGWTFLPGARDRHKSAATMIFDEAGDSHTTGEFHKERDDVRE
ncbi:MAG: cbb3-type cytochrome c oxidase subunit 3 [Sphingomonadales bacterium]|nr:MAG: cbb3-type cytochrome c oxidase subunit 3 [Sphingomonadales bacterium]TNF02190.1 MAG: cbb3-type cytochrome c oxidase subunit 3 [Sphingomonadales bacterium]